jgi:radical SAM protein with 4Fe4S-binding SPASM domain
MKNKSVRREITAAALEITLRCNMSCMHCGSEASGRERPEALSFDQWCAVIDDLKKLKTKYITLSGGEPFLYPRWRELVERIKDESTGVTFISNGYTVTEDDIIFMKKAGVEHLAVSLDGDEKSHNFIRRCPDSYQRIMELFRLGKKHDFSVIPATSVNKINFDAMETLLGALLEAGVKAWQIQVVNSFGRAGKAKDTMLLTPRQYTELCDNILKWQKQHEKVIRIMPADSLGYCHPAIDAILGDYEWQGCNAGLHVVGVQCDGTVLGCLSLQDKSFAAGNVKEKSLVRIWENDSAFASTRRPDLSNFSGSCGKCESASVCKAGCLGMAFSMTGGISSNPYCYKAIMESGRGVA